jgi:hypothetical protein
MLGRELLPEGSVAAIAVPPGPDSSSTIDERASVGFERKRDEDLIAISSE